LVGSLPFPAIPEGQFERITVPTSRHYSPETRDIIAPMNCNKFELPTAKGITIACMEFNDENQIIEDALNDLFSEYPSNDRLANVFCKVVTLNALYSTRIPIWSAKLPNVQDVAVHIRNLRPDQDFSSQSTEIVSKISAVMVEGKEHRNYFSFATKYASWHRREIYPIWDTNVQNYFTCLRRFHRADWDDFSRDFKLTGNWSYSDFHGLMVRFRDHYGLAAVSFKDLDKFLWLHGGKGKSGVRIAAAGQN
jgi:hypothetical protein